MPDVVAWALLSTAYEVNSLLHPEEKTSRSIKQNRVQKKKTQQAEQLYFIKEQRFSKKIIFSTNGDRVIELPEVNSRHRTYAFHKN